MSSLIGKVPQYVGYRRRLVLMRGGPCQVLYSILQRPIGIVEPLRSLGRDLFRSELCVE